MNLSLKAEFGYLFKSLKQVVTVLVTVSPTKKNSLETEVSKLLISLNFHGRCERIRTFDPLHPMQVRYQAAPHTDK